MADKEAIFAAYDAKTPVAQIAKDQGINPSRVYAILSKRGQAPGVSGQAPKVAPEDVVAAVEGGMTQVQVAEKYGITKGRVTQILGQHAPELLEALRAKRAASVSDYSLYRRELRQKAQAGVVTPAKRLTPEQAKEATLKALVDADGNVTHAAKALGVNVKTLRRRLAHYK